LPGWQPPSSPLLAPIGFITSKVSLLLKLIASLAFPFPTASHILPIGFLSSRDINMGLIASVVLPLILIPSLEIPLVRTASQVLPIGFLSSLDINMGLITTFILPLILIPSLAVPLVLMAPHPGRPARAS